MTGDRCLSTFLRTPCEQPVGHPGDHYVWDSCGHITCWDDNAADPTQDGT